MMFKLVFICFLATAAAVNLRGALESPGALATAFKEHVTQQGIQYGVGESRLRMRMFRDSVEEVIDCNENEAFKCTLNQFSTMTPQEKKRYLGVKNMTDPLGPRETPRGYLSSAGSVDWRESGAVTDVKNQGDCGSCYAFAAVGALEGAYKVKTGKLVDFSEQELLDCTYEKMYDDYNGCDGGFYDDCWEYVRRAGHLATSADYSYNGVCNKCNSGSAANALVDGSIKKVVLVDAGDDNLANAIALTPTAVAMTFQGKAFQYKSGVYDGLKDCACEFDPTNHALVAVGYTTDTFTIKNSWGAQWGDKGYMIISRGLNTCRVSDFPAYPLIRGTNEPTSEPPTFIPTPDPGCRDSNPSCAMWKDWGECWNNPDYMLTGCARSCNQCRCDDNHEKCEEWASWGECTANPNFMLWQCRKACEVCSDDDNPTPNPTVGPTDGPTDSPTDSPTDGPTDGPTPKPTDGPTDSPTDGPKPTTDPGCKDKNDRCFEWAMNGECYNGDWDDMFEKCPKSCHQCSCGDNHGGCVAWAAGGQCEINPEWMLSHCRASCGVCKREKCVDTDPGCPAMAAKGDCYTVYPWADIISKCPKSCHYCECGDNSDACPEFASRGDCQTSPGWMNIHCRKSCGQC